MTVWINRWKEEMVWGRVLQVIYNAEPPSKEPSGLFATISISLETPSITLQPFYLILKLHCVAYKHKC